MIKIDKSCSDYDFDYDYDLDNLRSRDPYVGWCLQRMTKGMLITDHSSTQIPCIKDLLLISSCLAEYKE